MTYEEKQKWPLYAKFIRAFLMPALGTIGAIFFAFWVWPHASNMLYPSSDYYDLEYVQVLEAALLEDYTVLATRVVKRDFDGSYQVTIRRLNDSEPVCSGGQELRYRPRADGDLSLKTVDFPLSVWSQGAMPSCIEAIKTDIAEHGPASYLMTTCIKVDEGLVLEMKSVCAVTVFAYPSTMERPA